MLAGQRPQACQNCFFAEDRGTDSHRLYSNEVLLAPAMAALPHVTDDGEIAHPPSHFDIRLGNLCNLRCRMCSPASSIALADDYHALYGRDYSAFRANAWLDSDALVEKIARSCGRKVTITVAGGEPFATPQFRELQRRLISLGYAGNVRLRIITNGTNLTPAKMDLLGAFRSVWLIVSLDGYAAVNEYIRYPSSFAKIDANLRRLHDEPQPFRLDRVEFNATVQAYNLFDLPNLFRYLARFPRFRWFPALSPLTIPEPFSVLTLPPASRALARAQLEKYREEVPGLAIAQKRLGQLLRFLEGEDRSALLPEFYRLTAVYDQRRGQKCPPIPGLKLPVAAPGCTLEP